MPRSRHPPLLIDHSVNGIDRACELGTLPFVDRPDVASRPGAAAAFIAALREADGPLNARALKQRLLARGVPADELGAAWRRAQPVLRRHAEIAFDAARGTYRYGTSGQPAPPLTGDEALDRLLPERMSGRQTELAAVVRGALKERDDLEARVRAGYVGGRELRAARERQIRIEAVRVLADVVAEVEELAAAGVGTDVAVERVRVLAHAFGLEPIGRAGEPTTYAAALHTAIGMRPADQSRVIVLRPGYTWRDGAEVVLIDKAHVVVAPQ